MVYRRTKRVAAKLASNRERIVRVARQLVAEGGFRHAQIAAVAAVADVAVGTIYRYFPSKADLFAEVVSRTSEGEVEVVARIAESEDPASQRLSDALRAFATRALRGRGLAHALIVEPAEPEVDAARLHYRRALGKALETIVADGMAGGEFPPQDVATSAACLVGALLEGLVGPLAPSAFTDDDEARRLIEGIVSFCLRGVSGMPAGPREPQ